MPILCIGIVRKEAFYGLYSLPGEASVKAESCNLIGSWYVKKGYHGEKYKQSLEYIKKNTYSEFIKVADKWKGASGRLE